MTFQWPQVLFGLALIPVLVGVYLQALRRRRIYTVRFTNLDLLEAVMGSDPGVRRHIPPALYLLGSAAMIISMARPQAVIKAPYQQAAVILAIDISGSMAADDMLPTRMDAAKEAADTFVHGLPAETQVGLVSFREFASSEVALTADHAQVIRGIENLSAVGGTAIGEAIYASLDQIALVQPPDGSQKVPAMIVLVTDGQSNRGRPPLDAAQAAKDAGVPIFTVGIGQRGIDATTPDGQTVGLDEETLQTISTMTGGQYFYAAESGQLTAIYQALSLKKLWIEKPTEITALVGGLGTVLFLLGGVLSLRWFQQMP